VQIILVITAPSTHITVKYFRVLIAQNGIKQAIRMIPKAPNFKRIAARIIDPAKGASTWALGSQIWKKYIGSFTINASKRKIISIFSNPEI